MTRNCLTLVLDMDLMQMPSLDYALNQTTLPNGLRVVTNHDPVAPGTALNIWYHVGSGDEEPQLTGFAHLFEHLMFCGSANVANSEHLPLVQNLGGQANATTSFDRTNYFETVPVGATELMVWLEADRLRSLDVSQVNLDTQRDVVKEEKRQTYDNRPYGDMLELLLALNFPDDHPYRHPTIGSMDDLDRASLAVVRDFHSRWYQPSNAVISVVSPLPDEQVLALIEHHFSDLPSIDAPQRTTHAALLPHDEVPIIDVTRDVPRTAVHLCWRTPELSSPDLDALDVAAAILTAGQSSRLVSQLVRGAELVEHVSCNTLRLERSSITSLSAMIREDVSPELVIDRLLDAVTRLATEPPTADEMSRIHAHLERNWFETLGPIDQRADLLGHYATHYGEASEINRHLARVLAITPDQVSDAVRRHLSPEARAELIYRGQPE